ncbi:transcriptional regulator, TetR family [Agromyces sp. CF514]|uniref:TetR/AcrR family transcriptional regulator n=1 Tax=Agromyces sp. CF514 TaxID=1881031 RepID=UPI0008F44E93|nr:TetR/AcrR family transcriptional regulator [Agromyces sp. CF514]SFR88883.1 transcriptional regulator, TetR family [Agromyces sp. CF514]
MTTTTGSARSRAPRATGKVRLDRETIVAAGLELAAGNGTTAISVRDLGSRLGADPTAIYRHFRNKEQLMQALLDELNARAVAAVVAEPADWQERLRQLASATLSAFADHPAIGVEAVVLTTHGPGELDAVELMLDAFARAGLADDEIVHHYALMASHVLSTAAGIARSRGGRLTPDDAPRPWFDGPILADPRTHPRIAALWLQISELEDDELFMLGVESIISSAEQTAASAKTAVAGADGEA